MTDHLPSPALRAAARTEVGSVRTRNEDACLVDEALGLLVVADGVGGGPAGDVASTLAIEEVRQCLDGGCDGFGDLGRALLTAHRALRRAGVDVPSNAGMATTVVAAWVDADAGTLSIGHVGDSRAYLRAGSRLRRLTDDHGSGSRLHQALGQLGDPVPEVVEVPLHGDELLLLCTDGVSDVLDEHQLDELLGGHDVGAIADSVVAAALAAGTRDNVTAVVADLSQG